MIGTFALLWALAIQAQAPPRSQPTEAVLRSQAIEAFAEILIAARATDRARLLADNPSFVNTALRYFVAKPANRAAAQHQYRAALDEAEQAYRARLTLAREMNDRDATASSIAGLATVAYSRADYTPALASYREALAMYRARPGGLGRSSVYRRVVRGRSARKSRPRANSIAFLVAPTNGIAFRPVSTAPRKNPLRFIVAPIVASAIAVPIHGAARTIRRDSLAPPHRTSRSVVAIW